MPNHAKEYSFDVIEFTLRANESCFYEFESRKTLMKVLTLMKVRAKRRALANYLNNKSDLNWENYANVETRQPGKDVKLSNCTGKRSQII